MSVMWYLRQKFCHHNLRKRKIRFPSFMCGSNLRTIQVAKCELVMLHNIIVKLGKII